MKLTGNNRGAVYVEFLIAFMPLFVFFQCLVQLSSLYAAKLVVQHSAVCAARAAIVVLHDDQAEYDDVEMGSATGKRLEEIELAAAIPLRAIRSIVDFEVTFPTTEGGDDNQEEFGRDDLVRVKVKAEYRCQIPFADRIVCNPLNLKREITAEAALPNQGADYDYPEDDED